MRRGDSAELKVKKVLLTENIPEDLMYTCKVLTFDQKEESLYFLLEGTELEELSLDNIYECRIKSKDMVIMCTGRIKERYVGFEGKKIRFQIENGFYKINIKSVDKQIV